MIRKRRGVRRGPWRSVKYRRWVASFPCAVTGRTGTQAAHTEHGGMSQKGSDASCVPLSPAIHDQYDGRVKLPNGKVGKKAFEEFYRVDLKSYAAQLYELWTGKKEAA